MKPPARSFRHSLLGVLLLLLASSGTAATLGIAHPPPDDGLDPSLREAEQPKNVLFLMVDDLRPALGAYGADVVSPHIDRLAAQGTLFERAYAYVATCSPSRATLLTGLRPDSLGFYGNVTPMRKALPNVATLPQHFKQNGYTTAAVGKIFHHGDPRSWDRKIGVQGRWKGRGYLSEAAIAAAMRAHEGRANPGQGPAYESPRVADTAYADGKIANRGIDALRRLRDRPFFLALGITKPHLPFNAPQKYWDLYPPEQVKLPDNYYPPENATPWSLTNFGELLRYTNIPDPIDVPVPTETALTLNRGYRACVSYVDAQIGRVLDELQRLGLEDETIVVLWGDHGFKLGEHGSWVKHTLFEIDNRVPLIVRAPGYAGGQRTHALVESVDLYPTLAELAGLPAPPQHQGLSFAPLLEDPGRPWKEAAFSQYRRPNSLEEEGVMGRALRTDHYRYVEWRDTQTKEVRARELYDHRIDPEENVNRAGDSNYAGVVERLSRKLKAGWRAALPDGVKLPSGTQQK